jgi:death on curing protein
MRYLTLDEVLHLHRFALDQSGGTAGIRDLGGLESAVAQPYMAFSGQDLYPTVVEKAAALAFSLINNHPFVDGNKRVGHAAMETFLVLNGHELRASVAEQERVFLCVAAGTMGRVDFTAWILAHLAVRPPAGLRQAH